MDKRWQILCVLFLARTTMAFQFQSIAALSPVIAESYHVTLVDIGVLIGLYLAPGIAVALPGGAIAARFGEVRTVAVSLGLMLTGGALIAFSESFASPFAVAISGRLISGTGGVIINVVMTKMLVDWFLGREINTAMAIFINSWPIGIAAALLVLPIAESLGGLSLARGVTLGFIAAALALFLLVYRAPAASTAPPASPGRTRLPLAALVCAGLVWALYNTALAMVFSFGPALLAQKGWSLAAASATTSLFMLLLAITVPLGGVLADKTGRRDTIILLSLVSYMILVPAAVQGPASLVAPMLLVAGALFGLAAGPIMTLPGTVLPAESRSFGMGVFFTIYYAIMMAAPALAGALSDKTGLASAAVYFGAALLAISVLALLQFRRLATAPA
ncbi:CynX/NimT family MFS transporter [Pseudoruegeria sp. SHC-113]|uniref:MFS transporter n=1 Tax=Pseudoruegeria sp. SHC-113 TaxID=2855439 RepID=UPI0021BA647C|nr:MFS transporter [Pseudoruegeria sp. SHC-113]MCT8159609.1 MFS transporter [Pseudoruegeria sp. SHC-113]